MSGGLLPDRPELVFRINDNGLGPDLLRQVFLERGWTEFDEENQLDYDWNLWWRTSRFRTSDYDIVYPWQRLNHYPKATMITKKDALARNLKRMRCVHGANVFNFSPLSFNLPNDYTKYVKTYGAQRQKPDAKPTYWICKPADLSRGRGIFIFRDLSELLYDCNAVVQQYIDNPLLIGGYKFDLRIYVAVTSFQPLRLYVHEEGIVRFSTEKFDLNSTKNVFAHLTNTSINKHSPGYTEDKERVGPGCKWTLTQLRHYFLGNNIDDRMLWQRIVSIVILTLLVQAPQVQKVDNCFELYGFDVLVDENLKAWLLEVNFSPSLSIDCQADLLAKKPMLHDLMDLLHYTHHDADRGGDSFRHHYNTFVSHTSHQQKAAQKGTRRGDRLRGQGRRVSRIHSGKTDSSMLGDSRENLSVGLSPGSLSSVQGDGGHNEAKRGSVFSKKGFVEDVQKHGDTSHQTDLRTSDRDQVLGNCLYQNEGSDLNSYSSPFIKQHSKTTVSADSHNSGGSDDSLLSKVSTDSGFGSVTKSVGDSAHALPPSGLGSRTELPSYNRVGSGLHRGEGRVGEELSLHLPSLENSSSSRRSTNNMLPSHRRHHTASEHEDLSHKPLAMKTLPSPLTDPSNPWRQHQDDTHPATHRSVASMSTVSGQTLASTSRLTSRYRRQTGPQHAPPSSKFMQLNSKQPRFAQQTKHSQHGSFAQLKRKVGRFFLVFPFNETTHKLATSLDPKIVIRETQNLMKESLNAVSNSKSSADHGGMDDGVGKQEDYLWAPVKDN